MKRLFLTWSWRDFRSRWVQILATALILACGIGAFFGVGGLREWRERSTDQSLAEMAAHDLRVDLPEGAYAREGSLVEAVRRGAADVAAAEERLIADSQAEVSRPGDPVLLPARLIGIPLRQGGQRVDRIGVLEGRRLEPADAARGAAVIDWNFARHYELPVRGELSFAGERKLPYVGQGVTPQHLLIVGESGLSGAESTVATVYLPLATAQRVAVRPGAVNELVVRAAPGAALDEVETQVRAALATELGGMGVTITRGDDETAQQILYRDARNDQQVFLALAVLLLLGAAIAAFNLVSRVVEAQRREIGTGMALGAEPLLLAIRPLALGVQIATLGVALGVPVGLALGAWIKELLKEFFPLPVYATTFPTELFLVAAALGVAIPLLAAALPVRRAVRVAPVDAIQTGHRAAKGGGAAGALRRLALPGGAVAQLPLRNLARTPRRTLLTVLGLGGVITAVVTVLAMVDAIDDTATRHEQALLSSSPARLRVELAQFEPAEGPTLRALERSAQIGVAEPGLTVPARIESGGDGIDVALEFVPSNSELWQPTLLEGSPSAAGISISHKASEDLGIGVGDAVAMMHPRRGDGGVVLGRSEVTVAAVHEDPVRPFVYADAAAAGGLGLGGIYNTVTVNPAPGADPAAVERSLFGRSGIGSVRPIADEAEALRTTVEAFSEAIQIVAVITLTMALLVAFTSTSVALDERRREYATMFAFGVPVRTGVRVSVTESLITGALGTAVGLGLGILTASWVIDSLMGNAFPDLGAELAFTAASLVLTLVVGILAFTLAPLLTARRMSAMDLPSTLRVME